MESDRLKWDDRYANKPAGSPDKFLIDNLHQLKKPDLLDIAGGNGRNTIPLALVGFHVTMIDISQTGIQNTKNQAIENSLSTKTLCLDLDNPEVLKNGIFYDTIICINFRPEPELLNLIPGLLKPEGIFLLCSFNELQAFETGFNMQKALKQHEFINFHPEMELVNYQRFTDITGKRDGYIYKKIKFS